MYSGFTMYHSITKYCDITGITLSVDGDDEVLGRQVFKVTNAVYQERKLGVMWTQFLRFNINDGNGFL